MWGICSPAGQTEPSSVGWYAVTFATYQKTTHDNASTINQTVTIAGRGRGVA